MKTKYETLHGQLLTACSQMLNILDKANSTIEKGIVSEEDLLNAPIAPDMFPFKRQVQIFSDNAKGAVARLSQIEAPKIADDEEILADLIARIEMTKNFIASVEPSALNAAGELEIHLGWMPEGSYFTGENYADNFVMQNTMFHLVTAYDILRMKGGEIGKTDFITGLEMKTK